MSKHHARPNRRPGMVAARFKQRTCGSDVSATMAAAGFIPAG